MAFQKIIREFDMILTLCWNREGEGEAFEGAGGGKQVTEQRKR